jgi:hypothetical protein
MSPGSFLSLGAPGPHFLIPGPGQILYPLFRTCLPGDFREWPLLGQISSSPGLVRLSIKLTQNFLGSFRSLSASGSDSFVPGTGEILYQIRTQNGFPGSFRSLGAHGLDSLSPGPGLILYQIRTQNVFPGSFRSLGAHGLDSLSPGPGQILYQIFIQNVSPD